MSSASASVAVTGVPTLVPDALFSGTERVVAVPENTGAVLVTGTRRRSVTVDAIDQSSTTCPSLSHR